MLMMARDRDYRALLTSVCNRHVLVWTCNTCVRLCGGLGGREAAERLAAQLRVDGVNVVGVSAVSASCLAGKVRDSLVPEQAAACDLILALTCNVGALTVGLVAGRPTLNPLITFGTGYLLEDGTPVLCVPTADGKFTEQSVSEFAASRDLSLGPFV